MARPVPRTKAGKQRKVANVMGEFKSGKLESSSGEKVSNPKQAIAIALSQTGQSRSGTGAAGSRRRSDGLDNSTGRLARELGRRIDEGQEKARRG